MNRLLLERVCRAVAGFCLLTALVLAVWPPKIVPMAAGAITLSLPDRVVSDSGEVALQAVRTWLVRQSARHAGAGARAGGGETSDTLVLPLRRLPGEPLRSGLMSLRASGAPVRWYDSTQSKGLALSVNRVASPAAPYDVRLAVPVGQSVVLRDTGGVLDSVVAASPTLSWRLQSASPPLEAELARSAVRLALPDSGAVRRILLLAAPGWESKFVAAALEEAGWQVDGSFRISPTGSTTLGAPQRLDTARYAAVVVLDSVAIDGANIRQFVERGGGLVLGGDALRLAPLAGVRPARATSLRGGIAGALLTDTPRRGLEAWELEPTPDAVVLQVDRGDHDHDEPALVARRAGVGRVVAMPYRETWRWRMQGTDDGLSDHRAWWTVAVAAAIPATRSASQSADGLPGAAAPYADLVARVGRPAVQISTPNSGLRTADELGSRAPLPDRALLLLLITLLALLIEWTSRRLRGLR